MNSIVSSSAATKPPPLAPPKHKMFKRRKKKNNLHFIAMRLGKKETNWIRSGHLKVVYKSGNFISICSLPVKHWDIFYGFAAILFFPFCFSGSSPKSCPFCMWRDLCLSVGDSATLQLSSVYKDQQMGHAPQQGPMNKGCLNQLVWISLSISLSICNLSNVNSTS